MPPTERRRHRSRAPVPRTRGLVVAGLAVLAACGGDTALEEVPEGMRGTWVTSDTRYADRAFRLEADRVVFYLGDGAVTSHTLVAIDTTVQEEGVLYALEYRSAAGHVYRFDLLYGLPPHGTIRFRNQRELIWRKTNTPPY